MRAVRIDPGQGGAVPGGLPTGAAQQSLKRSALHAGTAAQPNGVAGRKTGGDETAELRQAAQEFESFLLQQLLKQARASARLLGGDTQPEMAGRDIFESWQDESYANAVASAGGIGLADMLVRQLQPQSLRPLPVDAAAQTAPASGQIGHEQQADSVPDAAPSPAAPPPVAPLPPVAPPPEEE